MINSILLNNFYITTTVFFVVSILAILMDELIGEVPSNIHPVVFIGKLTNFFKNIYIKLDSYLSGLYLLLSVVVVFLIVSYIVLLIITYLPLIITIILFALLLSSTFSINLLLSSAEHVRILLENREIFAAREAVSQLVSRDLSGLNQNYVISATIESLTENVTDSVISPLFYYFVLGFLIIIFNCYNHLFDYSYIVTNLNLFVLNNMQIDANRVVIDLIFVCIIIAYLFRIANTQDAMVGYKTKKYIKIGFVPAICDDLLNFIPARITGYLMILSARILGMDWRNGLRIMRRDARACESPNSGYPMAAAAGSLSIQLIKRNNYILGDPIKRIEPYDIRRAYNLSRWTIFLFILFQFIILFLILIVMWII